MKTTIDLDRLAELALDLESGHPIESVLRKHEIPDRWSAYDLVIRQKKNRFFQQAAEGNHLKKLWKEAVEELEPCIREIAKELGL